VRKALDQMASSTDDSRLLTNNGLTPRGRMVLTVAETMFFPVSRRDVSSFNVQYMSDIPYISENCETSAIIMEKG